MRASITRLARSSAGAKRRRRPRAARSRSAQMSAIRGSCAQRVQDHLGTGGAGRGDGYLDGQAGITEQVSPVVLGDVVLLPLFLVELEEVRRPVG